MPADTCIAPVRIKSTIAIFISTYVSGLRSDETVPVFICSAARVRLFNTNLPFSSFSLTKALITLTPVRFSLTIPVSESTLFCIFPVMGMWKYMIRKTARVSAKITATNKVADQGSMVKAMIMAPNTTNGDLSKRRSTMFTPF